MKKFAKYLFSFVASCALACSMAACSDDDEVVVDPTPVPDPDAPEVIFEAPLIEVGCKGEETAIAYNIVNQLPDAKLEVKSADEWIHSFEVKKSAIEFAVDANSTAETRTGVVHVTYAGTESKFEVLQKAYETPFRLEVPEESVTETTAKFYAYPKDKNMTYLLSSIDKQFKDELGDDETVFKMVLANFQETAKAMNLSLSDFLKLNKLITIGDTTDGELSKGHKPNTEYYAFAVGMTYEGKKTTDIVYTPFRTKEVTGVDQTFDIKVDVSGLSVTLDVTPSKDDNYYLYGCIAQKELDQLDMTLEQKINKLMAENVEYGSLFGMTSDDVVKALCVLGHDSKTIDGLNGDSEYWAYAVGVSLSGQLNSQLASKQFITGGVPMSENEISVAVDHVGVDNVHIVIETTNDDPYAMLVEPAAEYVGKTDAEILEMLMGYDLSHNMQSGNFKGTAKDLMPGSDYYVFSFGYLGGQANTGLSKCAFTTIEAGDPATFAFSTEISDITVRSARITAHGTPETLLYYWDVVPANSTDEEILQGVEYMIQSYLIEGLIQVPLDYYRAVGTRGTQIHEFKNLKATTEYVPIALAIDEFSGTHVGGVFRGTPFRTKELQISDATVKVTFDKYWDGDQIASRFMGYEEFGGQNLYCVPLTVETTGEIRDTYFSIFLDDMTDPTQYDDDYWIEKLYTKGGGTTRRKIQYFLPYDETCTIVAVAIDSEGNFTKVFRTLINKSMDGISDIEEFVPFDPESTTLPRPYSAPKAGIARYNSGKNVLTK